jgi:hypothetical protein
MASKQSIFIGIDVGQSECALCFLDRSGVVLATDWAEGRTPSEVVHSTRERADLMAGGSKDVHIGIDAPRQCLLRPRKWYWDSHSGEWRPRKRHEKGHGRHCEVVVAALKLAKPQWTPLSKAAPKWMHVGFDLFKKLAPLGQTYEVFPSASYRQLKEDRETRINLSFAAFAHGPKDMLDACVAATTTREFCLGRGSEVGGGDDLGTIVLPRPIDGPYPEELLCWPAD